MKRRQFLQSAAAVTVGFGGLQALNPAGVQAEQATGTNQGLLPDPEGIFDLPEGFSYKIVSRLGDKMDDGFFVPGRPDGMAAFHASNGITVVVRNHELNVTDEKYSAFGPNQELFSKLDPSQVYDAANGKPCFGGTTNFTWDTRNQRLVSQRLSLGGTLRNCAGGPTPWGTWITCEETVLRTGEADAGMMLEKDHGYNFEVPAWGTALAAPVPIKGMGRFNHEAVAVDPKSGIVFQTEDAGDGLIYRYIPNTPGRLLDGGKLQALAIKGRPKLDTRNWSETTVKPGEELAVEWIDVENPESPENDLRFVNFEKGAARFARGEGMWYGNDGVYWACTNGGVRKKGQIWKYTPSPHEGTELEADSPGTLVLFIEPNDGNIVDNADNLTVAPWGDVVLCEDGSGPDQFLLGVTPQGKVYRIGRNAISKSELAGVCFSPDGSTLFVNIQHNHITLAITGPWESARA